MRVNKVLGFVFSSYCALCSGEDSSAPSTSFDVLRLNQLQYIGTHNSYHIAPDQTMGLLMLATGYQKGEKWAAEVLVPALDYSPPPIEVQLALGLRMFELDVYDDPKGGRFASPGIFKALKKANLLAEAPYDPQQQMRQPGFKVLHAVDYDVRSTCKLLKACLQHIMDWSLANPGHIPIQVHIEPKKSNRPPVAGAYNPIVVEQLGREGIVRLTEEILSVIPRTHIVTPDDVRGDAETLKQAISKTGWPTMRDLKGKIMLSLFHPGEVTNHYIDAYPNLAGGLFFVNDDDAYSAVDTIKMFNKPHKPKHYGNIKSTIAKGYLAYTRSDANTVEARNNEVRRRNKAFNSGAHFISTDYPFPDYRFSDYNVQFENGKYVRCNPKTFSGECPL